MLHQFMVSIVLNPGAREFIKPPVAEILRNLITTDKNQQINNYIILYCIARVFPHRLRRHCQDHAAHPTPSRKKKSFVWGEGPRLGYETGPESSSKRVTPPKIIAERAQRIWRGSFIIHGIPSGIIREILERYREDYREPFALPFDGIPSGDHP